MNLEPFLVKQQPFSALFRHVIVATVKLVEHFKDKGILLNWAHVTLH